MGAPIAAFLTLLLSLLLLRRLVFKPVAPGIDGALLDGSAIAALNRDRLQQLEERSIPPALDQQLLPLPETSQQARKLLIELKQLSHGSSERWQQQTVAAASWLTCKHSAHACSRISFFFFMSSKSLEVRNPDLSASYLCARSH